MEVKDLGTVGKINLMVGPPPVVKISHRAAILMKTWVMAAPGEISWFGTLYEKNGDPTVLYVDDVILPTQECSGVHSTVPPQGIFEVLDRVDELGIKDRDIRFWGHSHASFDTFWSGTDRGTQEIHAEGASWLSLVTNKAAVKPYEERPGTWKDNFAKKSLATYITHAPVRIVMDGLAIEELNPGADLLKEAVDVFRGKITNLPEGFEPRVESGRLLVPSWIPEVKEEVAEPEEVSASA